MIYLFLQVMLWFRTFFSVRFALWNFTEIIHYNFFFESVFRIQNLWLKFIIPPWRTHFSVFLQDISLIHDKTMYERERKKSKLKMMGFVIEFESTVLVRELFAMVSELFVIALFCTRKKVVCHNRGKRSKPRERIFLIYFTLPQSEA